MVKFLFCCLIAFALYFMVSGITFKIRHPWATDTQVFARIDSVIRFETLPKSDFEQFQK